MSETKPTPGSWHYQKAADSYTHIVRDEGNHYVCGCSQDSGGNAEANAHLIAAAPELLGALKRATELLWATERFMAANPVAEEFTVDYDEATCDGACLAEDCRVAAIVAGEAIERAEGQS